MLLHAFTCFYILLHAFTCFYMLLHAFKAKVSEEEEVDRWSRVYRLLPAEAGKNIKNSFGEMQVVL